MDRISAFIDGETSPTEARDVMGRLKGSDDCCETWRTFHLIGDVMRGDPPLREDFVARFSERLAHEPSVLAPRMIWRKAANYALSAAASIAAVAVVLTLVLTDNPLKPQVQLAAAPKAESASEVAVAPRPVAAAHQGRVNEYLMAHQEYSPSTVLQGVAPYVRTVAATDDGSER